MNEIFPSRPASHRSRAAACLLVSLAVSLILPLIERADAQPARDAGPETKLVSPVAYRVYQRGGDGLAVIPVTLDPDQPQSITGATVAQKDGTAVGGVKLAGGNLVGVPAGGPYTVTATVKQGVTTFMLAVENVFVGDLWVLAGGANMVGGGLLVNVTDPNPQVTVQGSDGRWKPAAEPLMAPAPARGQPKPARGAGLGLPFATEVAATVGVPVGLVAAASADSALADWTPAKQDAPTPFQDLVARLTAGGVVAPVVKGVLWFQGEQDAPAHSAEYAAGLAALVKGLRGVPGNSGLPFIAVQLGRTVRPGDPAGWNTVREAQRRLPERLACTAVVASVDLELDGASDIGTQGQKRLGRRLARVAEREVYGLAGAAAPALDRVGFFDDTTILVRFKGVSPAPAPAGPVKSSDAPATPAPAADGSTKVVVKVTTPAPASADAAKKKEDAGAKTVKKAAASSPSPLPAVLSPLLRVTGFSVRDDTGKDLDLVYEAAVTGAGDAVKLMLTGPVPEHSYLWYGYGFNPDCNLTDGLDMAVPAFGPIALDDVR